MQPISILSSYSLSALGKEPADIWKKYLSKTHFLRYKKTDTLQGWVGAFVLEDIKKLQNENNTYKNLDRSVCLAILAARGAVAKSPWQNADFGINIGSSRGATALFEKYYHSFLEGGQNKVPTRTSPTTTLGNIASWVAQDLQNASGIYISHSITCSTALHSFLNGIAWLASGLKDKFLVGGSEAANTPFTLAQMKALKIYNTADKKTAYPCLAGAADTSKNTMVLGEGAAVFCLERGVHKDAQAFIVGIGYATEPLTHCVSLSTKATCFQSSMQMALKSAGLKGVDVVVMHAPGTIQGDSSERNAIKTVFKNKLPLLTTNKWKIGHTLGASGALSVDFALQMLAKQKFIKTPFESDFIVKTKLDTLMVNAVGFGANAVSIILKRAP